MRVQLGLKRRAGSSGYAETVLVHIKAQDADGRYLAFARHTPALLQYLTQITIDVPERLLVWRGHGDAPGGGRGDT